MTIRLAIPPAGWRNGVTPGCVEFNPQAAYRIHILLLSDFPDTHSGRISEMGIAPHGVRRTVIHRYVPIATASALS